MLVLACYFSSHEPSLTISISRTAEHLNHLPNHSTRGPNEDWIKYRDDPGYGVSAQIEQYERFVEYWMEKYPDRSQLLMLSYEDLTDGYLGPVVATRIAEFLGQSEGVNPIARESIPCVWETIVNYKNHPPTNPRQSRRLLAEDAPQEVGFEVLDASNGGDPPVKLKIGKTHADPSSLRTGPKVRPWTEQNLTEMLAMFERLVQKYSFDEDFVRIMANYIETVKKTSPAGWA